jgi:septum formation protein
VNRPAKFPAPPGPLVLASGSPRRSHLLREAGARFRIVVPEVDETPRTGETPLVLARRLALEKATSVHARRARSWCLGADTIVVLDGRVFGKPRDRAEARRMLRTLSGRTHVVYTAVALIGPGFARSRIEASRVRFHRLSEARIRDYVRVGESLDKAGAYALQADGGLVARVTGDRTNVIGLPMKVVRELLRAAAKRRASPARRRGLARSLGRGT